MAAQSTDNPRKRIRELEKRARGNDKSLYTRVQPAETPQFKYPYALYGLSAGTISSNTMIDSPMSFAGGNERLCGVRRNHNATYLEFMEPGLWRIGVHFRVPVASTPAGAQWQVKWTTSLFNSGTVNNLEKNEDVFYTKLAPATNWQQFSQWLFSASAAGAICQARYSYTIQGYNFNNTSKEYEDLAGTANTAHATPVLLLERLDDWLVFQSAVQGPVPGPDP